MSDTSILGYYDDGGQNFGRKNCWNQCGANVCVGVLTLFVIALAVVLIYLSHKHDLISGLSSKKNNKTGKNKGKGQKPSPAENPYAYADPNYYQQHDGYYDQYASNDDDHHSDGGDSGDDGSQYHQK